MSAKDAGGHIKGRALVSIVTLLALVSCSGGDSAETSDSSVGGSTTEAVPDAPVPTTVSPAPTTTGAASTTVTAQEDSPGTAQGRELCQALAADLEGSQDVDVFDRDALEEATRRSLAALEQMAGEVPAELEDAFSVLLTANKEYLALLEENDWNLFAIDEDDPRVTRMSSDEVLRASQAIADFCELDPGRAGSSDTTVSGGTDDLMPPGAGQVLATDPILMVESKASYENLVDHYASLLGRAPVDESEEGGMRTATFIAEFQGDRVALWVQETAEGVIVEISSN